MIKQETIKLKTNRRGTFVKYFTTYPEQQSEDGLVSYFVTAANNAPIKIVDSYLDTQIYRNPDNNFELLTGIHIYTGTTIKQTSELLSQVQKDKISNNYNNFILNQHLSTSSGNTSNPISYVQFEDAELDDMYINISLHRNVDTLDTLNVYNLAINNTTAKEAKTGILFGKLEAIQNVQDENGEKIKIPLKNTPVAVFNPSEEFPTIGVNNEDDNRITLNLKENLNIGSYFNIQSQKTDLKYLTDTSNFDTIPEKYKYSSITNENGEFIIYDVPVGQQSFMYEVDMLKQGLTPDEVALNFFQYPTEDNPNIDRVPHFFFRQFPVNIVPAWGDFQTGYTELNITVTLDLRKWCTYYISPIAYKNKSIEEMFSQGVPTRLTVAIRDMTKKIELDRKPVEVVEVADIYSRNLEQVTEWAGEFKQKKNKAEFYRTAFNVFKLPANLYDPNGINSQGVPGVWLCAYQFKMYYSDESSIYRATGFEREWITNFGPLPYNHLDLTRNAERGNTTSKPVGKIGIFPYEKPWTINYPEPYKVPKPPQISNPNKQYLNGESIIPTEPPYLDGDKAGFDFNSWQPVSGYGFQNIGGNLNPNQFAREVTNFFVYKYESGITWHEQYSNGYNPTFPNSFSPFGTVSNVTDGEKWQRLESGYAYWLRPEGWPRIKNYEWGDALLESDYIESTEFGPFAPELLSPQSYYDKTYKLRENILLKMDNSVGWLKTGALDIYRIQYPELVTKPLPPPVEKFIKIHFQRLIFSGKRFDEGPTWLSLGSANDTQFNEVQFCSLRVANKGSTKVTVTVGGETKEIEANGDYFFQDQVFSKSELILPANNKFDSNTNSYLNAKYELTLWSISNDVTQGGPHDQGTGDVCYGGVIRTYTVNDLGLEANTEDDIPSYYLSQIIPDKVWIFPIGIQSNLSFLPRRLIINGFAFMTWNGAWPLANNNDWVVTYYPGSPMPTPNSYTYLTKTPVSTPLITPGGGNYPYGLI